MFTAPATTLSLSPELAFVLACASPGGTALPSSSLDGALVAAIARRHQIVPLIAAAYRLSKVPVPPALLVGFAPLASLAAAHAAVRLAALLEAEGIAPLFLKGSTLAVLAHDRIDRRQAGDIDVLVRPSEAARAAATLAAAGYRTCDGSEPAARVAQRLSIAKDLVLLPPDGGVPVELHWRTGDDPRELPARDVEPLQQVALAPGASITTLGPEPLFAYLCAHGAGHGWARLRWLSDVAALLVRAPDGGASLWRGAVARRRRIPAASAIILAGEMFGTPAPPGFEPPRSARLALLLALARRTMIAGGGTTELAQSGWRGWTETGAKLLIASTRGDLAGWSLRLLLSPDDVPSGRGRLRYVKHALARVPRLLARRRRRRR